MSNNDISNITISNDVISTIAGVAATDVDGVFALSSSNIKDFFNKNNAGKGVIVEVDGENIAITINMVIKYNYKIQEVAQNVQDAVMRSVTDMTNYTVSSVNVNVVSVNIPKNED